MCPTIFAKGPRYGFRKELFSDEQVKQISKEATTRNYRVMVELTGPNAGPIFTQQLSVREILQAEGRGRIYTLSLGDTFGIRLNGFIFAANQLDFLKEESREALAVPDSGHFFSLQSTIKSIHEQLAKSFDPKSILVTHSSALDYLSEARLTDPYAVKIRHFLGYAGGIIAPKNTYQAMRRLLKITEPRRAGLNYSLIPVLKRRLRDPLFIAGAARGVSKVISRLVEANTDKPIQGDLWTDIHAGFRESGFNVSDAKEMTFELLGLYGSRGPENEAIASTVDCSEQRAP